MLRFTTKSVAIASRRKALVIGLAFACVAAMSVATARAAIGDLTTWTGGLAGYSDGPLTAARYNLPRALAADNAGNIFVADAINNRIRRVSNASGAVTIGGTGVAGTANGASNVATFSAPMSIATDGTSVFVVDLGSPRIRRISGGQVTDYAGGSEGKVDGPLATARFKAPLQLTWANGVLYVKDYTTIRKISGGIVTTIVDHLGQFGGGTIDGSVNTSQPEGTRDWGLAASGDALYFTDTIEKSGEIRITAIRSLTLTATATLTNIKIVPNVSTFLAAMATGLDGSLYWAEINTVSGWKIYRWRPGWAGPIEICCRANAPKDTVGALALTVGSDGALYLSGADGGPTGKHTIQRFEVGVQPAVSVNLTLSSAGRSEATLQWLGALDPGSSGAFASTRVNLQRADGLTLRERTVPHASATVASSEQWVGIPAGTWTGSAVEVNTANTPSTPAISNAVAVTGRPGIPTDVSATLISGTGKVSVDWNQPIDTGGTPVTGSYVTLESVGSGITVHRVVTGASTNVLFANVTAGTYRALVTTDNGTRSATASSAGTLAVPTGPSRPRNVTATVTAAGGLVVNWQPPASNGGAAITGYRVILTNLNLQGFKVFGGTPEVRDVPATTTSATFSSGRSGDWEVSVIATNKFVPGAPSPAIPVTLSYALQATGPRPPGVAAGMSTTTRFDGFQVSWAPGSTWAGVTDVLVTVQRTGAQTDNAPTVAVVSGTVVSGNVQSVTFPNLGFGDKIVSVMARNAQGLGAPLTMSAVHDWTVLQVNFNDTPSAPVGATVDAGLLLSWTRPTYLGRPSVDPASVTYEVLVWQANNGSPWFFDVGSATSLPLASLPAGSFVAGIRAKTPWGTGPTSTPVSFSLT
jgi:hypothetical protein